MYICIYMYVCMFVFMYFINMIIDQQICIYMMYVCMYVCGVQNPTRRCSIQSSPHGADSNKHVSMCFLAILSALQASVDAGAAVGEEMFVCMYVCL